MRLTTTLIAAVLAVATAQAQTPAALQDYLDLGGGRRASLAETGMTTSEQENKP